MTFSSPTRKVDRRLPGKGHSNSHGAWPVHQIISMMKWIRTSRLSIKKSLFSTTAQEGVDLAFRGGLCEDERAVDGVRCVTFEQAAAMPVSYPTGRAPPPSGYVGVRGGVLILIREEPLRGSKGADACPLV